MNSTMNSRASSGRSSALFAVLLVVFGVLVVRMVLPGDDAPTETGFEPGYELPLVDEPEIDADPWTAPAIDRDPFDPAEAVDAPQAQRTTTEPTE